jgi:four helix bundle protein
VCVSRDFKKLRVFLLADALVLDVYQATSSFPVEERYGLQSQLRRASLSVPCNIVEGSARSSNPDYGRFLRIACGSATESRYLLTVAGRLGYLPSERRCALESRFDELVKGLEALCKRVEATPQRPKSLPATQR